MNKLLSLFFLLSSSVLFGMGTEPAPEPEKAAEAVATGLTELVYSPHGDRLTFNIDARALSKHVVHADKVGMYTQKMNDMRNLIGDSPIVQHALEQFQSVLIQERAPWSTEERKIKNGVKILLEEQRHKLTTLSRNIQAMESADRTKLFPGLVEGLDPEFENTMSWNSALSEKKELLKKFAAMQFVSSLLELQELEEMHAMVKAKPMLQPDSNL